METLLAGMTPAMSDNQRDTFYGRGWLLSHYLLMDRKRAGQLDKFILGLAGGLTEIDAAHQAFGDLSRLDRELDIYGHTQSVDVQGSASAFGVGQIAVTRLSEGAARMMPVLARVKYGFEGEDAEALADEARAIEKSVSRRRVGRNRACRGRAGREARRCRRKRPPSERSRSNPRAPPRSC